MRFELAGNMVRKTPLVVTFEQSGIFNTLEYVALGYTNFDVICIGAGGGMGGGIDTANTGTLIKNYGGAGGGGGFHRVQGLLADLPDSFSVAVGIGGNPGNNHASAPASTTDGQDGGSSSFNDTTCRASGGKGGKRAQSNSTTVGTQADGGEGGIGNRDIAGGGAAGGVAGVPTADGVGNTPGTDGVDGQLFNSNLGEGGGGGAGGVGLYGSSVTCVAGTYGGRGAYDPNDVSVSGSGQDAHEDPFSGAEDVAPGGASGAKASPLNGLPYIYGQSMGEHAHGSFGVVVVLLTAE